MVDPRTLFLAARELGITLFCGVPDSLLRYFTACISNNDEQIDHVIVANEGAGIALATGHHLATGGIGLVYMQNSGIGNAANPLLSLAARDVYGIPVLLIIGWRGEPGVDDEPQHLVQGRVTLPLLDALEVPHRLLPNDTQSAVACLQETVQSASSRSCPEAIIVQHSTFQRYPTTTDPTGPHHVEREEAVGIVLGQLDSTAIVVSSTGKLSRELYEYRSKNGVIPPRQDFLTVGSMGHASQIALGLALGQPTRRVYCLDGDAALIMHMGSLAISGSLGPRNFTHIVLNNGCHESVGGQRSAAFDIDIKEIARACGYRHSVRVSSVPGLHAALQDLKQIDGPHMVEVVMATGSRDDLGRPWTSPSQNKESVMEFLQS
jgi:phosphonopyruvate decarboxylase